MKILISPFSLFFKSLKSLKKTLKGRSQFFPQFISVQSLSRVWLFATPWTAVHQASLSITNSQSLFKLMSIESEMPSNHLILCRPLVLLPSIIPSIGVFSNESVLRIGWPNSSLHSLYFMSPHFNLSTSVQFLNLFVPLHNIHLSKLHDAFTMPVTKLDVNKWLNHVVSIKLPYDQHPLEP